MELPKYSEKKEKIYLSPREESCPDYEKFENNPQGQVHGNNSLIPDNDFSHSTLNSSAIPPGVNTTIVPPGVNTLPLRQYNSQSTLPYVENDRHNL